MAFFYGVVAFILGLAIGSFLNVCIYRVPAGMSVSYPPSHCPTCATPIRPIDNVPVLSYLLLRGECRSCHASISWRYPAVELLAGITFLLIAFKFGFSLRSIAAFFFVVILIVVSFIDLDTERIPNKIILPAIGVGAALMAPGFFGLSLLPLNQGGSLQPLAGFFLGGGSLFAISLIAPIFFKRDAMGGGDIKLAAFIGIFLGTYVLLALFLSFLSGAVAGVLLMASGIRKRDETIPFAPYMALGSTVTMLTGPRLWELYLRATGLT